MKARFLLAAAYGLLMPLTATAADIEMLAAGAMKEIILELVPEFERSSGNRIIATWTGSADIRKRLGAGEAFDLVIVGAKDVDTFIKDGKALQAFLSAPTAAPAIKKNGMEPARP